jgi:methionine-rich copper-binding protein CopC
MIRCLKIVLALLAVVASPLPALAHAHLTKSQPEVGSEVGPTATLKLFFSEGVEIGLSKFDLTGPTGQPVAGAKAALDPSDNKQVLVSLTSPLAPGVYKMHWHVVSVDTHRTEGTYDFTVK